MKQYETGDLRNICICGSGTTGKTQFAEIMLHSAGAIERLGNTDSGNSTCDYNPDEIERKISIRSAIAFCEWKDKKINIIDTPGYADFVGEMIGGISVADTVILNICAFEGVGIRTERVWEYAQEKKKPAIIFTNRMDKENANFDNVVTVGKEKLTPNIAPITIPIGSAETFSGIVNLLTNKAIIDGNETEIPEEVKSSAQTYRDSLIETIASSDDSLTEKYLDGKELTPDEIKGSLKKGIIEGKIVPLFAGSSLNNIGIGEVLDFIVDYLPSPLECDSIAKVDPKGDLSALVFKTSVESHMGVINYMKIISGSISAGSDIYNVTKRSSERMGQLSYPRGKNRIETKTAVAGDIMAAVKLKSTGTNDTLHKSKKADEIPPIKFPEPLIDMAVYAKSKGDEEKIGNAIHAATIEDSTLRFEMDKETKEFILSGIGGLQLEIVVDNAKKMHDLEVELKKPRIPYKETILGKSQAQGKHKKQSGGRGQYGDCNIRIEPLERGKGFEFVNSIFGGSIPSSYIPSVEKGIKAAMEKGFIAGYPAMDVKVELIDGSYHDVDSSNIAFEIAGSIAIRKAFEQATPCLLEPIVDIEVIMPEEFMGSVIGDLNSRRGRVLGMGRKGKKQSVKAQVPLGEVFNYATDLRSLTKGSADSRMDFSHYEVTPGNVSQSLVEEYQKQREEGKLERR